MRCADAAEDAGQASRDTGLRLWLRAVALALLAGCSHTPASDGQPVQALSSTALSPHAGTAAGSTRPLLAAVALPPPRRARHWDDYRLQAAQRMVAASPGATYSGPVPEPLLAIPVLTIDLNSDGSVRRIQVLRRPTQALDTVQLAIAAVHRAAPFGPVGHLPKPWTFNEVFLFDDARRFKPRTLDD